MGRWVMAKKAIFKMATAAILNFKKNLIFGYVTTAFDRCTEFHQKQTIFHWHNGDVTIFKMAAVHHVGFLIFADLVI